MTARAAVPIARSRVGAVLALARWPNALIAAGGVGLGAWWALPAGLVPGGAAWTSIAWAAAAAIATAACINAVNDLADVEIDRVAHPARPLVRGELTTGAARAVAACGAGAALLCASLAGGMVPALVAAALAVGAVYSLVLKPLGLAGNVAVAVVASLPFVVGAAAVRDTAPGLVLLAVAVPLHLAREVVKDVADRHADAGRRRTLAVVRGVGAARGVALAAVVSHALLVTFLFAPSGWRRLAFLPAVGLALAAAARAASPRAASLLKLAMLLAMAALPLLR